MSNSVLFYTDLDGTLLNSRNQCSDRNRSSLHLLREKNHIGVAATGRSLYSVHKVLEPDFPIDYLIFSSGAGIMDWKHKKFLVTHSLSSYQVIDIANSLRKRELDFMIHYPIPENHHFVYHASGKENPDFYRRIKIYENFAEDMNFSPETFGRATQFIAIVENNQVMQYNHLCEKLQGVKVIRATSPLDHHSIWIEIFPASVSKGMAAKYLTEHLGLKQEDTVGIGNDYNDIDLLRFTSKSWVVENAPDSLKREFQVTGHHNKDGFSMLVDRILIK